MSKFSLTYSFDTLEDLKAHVAKVAGTIDYLDRPDVGAPVPPSAPLLALVPPPPAPPVLDTAAIFGGAAPVAPVAPPPLPPAPPVAPEVAAAPVVPLAPPATPTVSPSGKPLDKRGLPWDSRIHATNAEKTGGVITEAGVWRKKRGLNDEALVKRIEAELLQAMAAPPAAASSPSAAAAPTAAPAAAPVAVVTPPAAPTPTAPAATTAAVGSNPFAAFMARIAPTLTGTPGAQEKLQQALLGAGLLGVGQLAARHDLIPGVSDTFDALIASA